MKKRCSSNLHVVVCRIDKGYTSVNLASEEKHLAENRTKESKIESWRRKTLHGRYVAEIEGEGVDKKQSLMWLKKGYLYPETEGFIMAIQDQVIETRNYRKHILKESEVVQDHCRVCGQKPETIQHLTAGCEKLAPTEYKERHDKVAKVLAQCPCKTM